MARPRMLSLAFLATLFLTQISCAQARKIKRQSENNLISSGTCYYGSGKPADSVYIPCGNTAFGNFHCCEAQSNCLDNNACFDGDQGTTYVAGCTDPTYEDSSCPTKGIYSAQQWSGLVYCNGTTSDDWTLCDDAGAGNEVVYVGGCYCPVDESQRIVAFSASSVLGSQLVLPAATGETMSLFTGFTLGTVLTSTPTPTTTTTTKITTPSPSPTTTSIKATTTTTSKPPSTTSKPPTAVISTTSFTSSSSFSSSSSTSRLTTTSSSQSSSSTTSASPAAASTSGFPAVAAKSSSLSTGAKAGIGVAAAIGGIALIAALAFLAVCLRRRKRTSMLSSEHPTYDPNAEVQPMSSIHQQQFQAPPPQNPNRYSPAWSAGGKSELAGDTSTSSPSIPQSNWSRPLSEAEGNYPTYQSMAGSSELAGTYQPSRQYQQAGTTSSTSQGSYRPGRRAEGGERGMYEMPAHLPGSTMM